MTSTLITVAPTGAETAKADCPALPTTLQGLTETVAAVRENTALIVQLSTGGAVTDPFDHRLRLRVLDAAPDSCSLMGTGNFGDDVFMNPWPFVTELYQLTQEREVVPEFELFDLGQAAALGRLLDKYGPPYGGKVHCDLVMGVPGGMPGTTSALVAAVNGLPAASRLGRPRASAVRRCRSRWPRCPAAGTSGSGWKTPSRWPRVSRSATTRNWSSAPPPSRRWLNARRCHPTTRAPS
ncbi:MAG: 3-keto-5-aminohexanoate cleavage enzyme [Kribbellaceae bacterium]|jgi:uncharacterized protein (DUF849 family)|nr:3-keto-5-aminohexanoate cleavage enzyme [Kribbellaceae bacterium]